MQRIIWILIFHLAAPTAWSAQATIAVATNFAAPLSEIAEVFEAQSGHHLTISMGSSGSLYAQIQNGAPFDVFLSADQLIPEALENSELIVPASRFTYAVGAIVLWSADAETVDQSGSVLRQNNFRRLAIANPETAPYGQAAIEVLQSLSLEAAIRPKLVMGQNIAQTYQFVASGNAQLGFVALSQISQNDQSGSLWVVPRNLYGPILQDAVLLKNGADNEAAHAFIEFLRGPTARQISQSYGYLMLANE